MVTTQLARRQADVGGDARQHTPTVVELALGNLPLVRRAPQVGEQQLTLEHEFLG